jgi:hypothetical protein
MKPLIRFAAKLYPRSWRERYGAEFEALLDDTGADPRVALNVFTEAIGMQVQRWKTIGSAGLLGAAALCLSSWLVGQYPHITPGTQLVFRQDSNLGAVAGFVVFLVSIVGGLVASILRQDGRSRAAKRVLGHPPEPSSCTWPQYYWSLFLLLGPSSALATVTAMTFGASVFRA